MSTTSKSIGVYDPSWDHTFKDDLDGVSGDEFTEWDAKLRIEKRDYVDKYLDALTFIEDHGLELEFKTWLLKLYQGEEG